MIRETSSRGLSLIVLAPALLLLAPGSHAANPAPPPATKSPAPAAPTPAAPASAPDATKINGAEVEQDKGGQVIGLNFKDATTLTEADYKQIRQLEGLKKLAFAHGPDDASLKILAGMPAIETFTTNGSHLTDAGLATLATFPALQNLTFFHPGKDLTGTGLSALSTLPHLESFSLGGSNKFNDASLAAVAKLSHLKELRFWHVGVTSEGVKVLLALKELKSLMFGQTLDMKAKPALTDDSVAVVAQITSLESLTLQESRLSLAALSKLKQLPNLKRLTLTDIDLSESDLASLKAELPKVAVVWTAPKDRRRIDAQFGPSPNAPATPPVATAAPTPPPAK